MTLSDPSLPEWFKYHGFEEYSDILTKELGVEVYDDFRLLRDEKDANELLDDITNLKAMDDTFKQKFKTEIMKIIKGIPPPSKPKPKPKTKPKPKSKSKPITIKTDTDSRSDPPLHNKRRKSRTHTPPTNGETDTLPKPKRITKSASADTRPSHQKSRSSLTGGKKGKSKTKSSTPKPHSPIPKPSKKDRHKKTTSSFTRSSTHNRIHTKATSMNMDKYYIGIISSKLPYNKKSKNFKKSHSTKDFNKKSKHKTSSSLGLFDAKSRRQHKEEKNKTRGGFTVHTNRRVRLDDGRIGVVKYKGRTSFGKSSEDWIGIVIEYGKGQHNGSVQGRQYFRCRDGKGIMIQPDRIIEDLGNPMTKPLDSDMKKGSPEIQSLLKEIARERKEEARRKKQAAMEAAAAKERSNYGGDIGWKPGKFDDYKEDH
eukprot:892221_1